MKKIIFSGEPMWTSQILGLIRIIVGASMIYHGWEVFDKAKMLEYGTWDTFKSSGVFWVYMGKSMELLGGILLAIGFLTRLASLLIAGPMIFIIFALGNGKVWYEDQYPFLFLLLTIIFYFAGPGSWSVDNARVVKDKP